MPSLNNEEWRWTDNRRGEHLPIASWEIYALDKTGIQVRTVAIVFTEETAQTICNLFNSNGQAHAVS